MTARKTATRAVWLGAAIVIGVATVAVLVFVAGTIRTRIPYWGEAEVVFEAARIRSGKPLFVDPLVGTDDTPPSRYYVTYPPIVSALLSLAPLAATLLVGRVVACLAWFGALAYLVANARKKCRSTALAAAGYVAGIWLIANFASTGRPDSLACAFLALGLGRATRQGRIDLLTATCLVLAPWIKPTLLGAPAGAFLGDLIARRSARSLVLGGAVAAAIGGVLWLASGGQIIAHVVHSNAQGFRLAVWLDQVPGRLAFFLPLFGVALLNAFPGRREPGTAIAGAALIGSTLWTLVALSKVGSAGNYWMEPCIAAVALLAQAPNGFRFGHGLRDGVLTLAVTAYTATAGITSSWKSLHVERAEARFIDLARERCTGGLTAADAQGIELALDGRILTPAYQMTYLVLAGAYPVEPWLRDLEHPAVRCFVRSSRLLDAIPPISDYLSRSFVSTANDGDLELLERVR